MEVGIIKRRKKEFASVSGYKDHLGNPVVLKVEYRDLQRSMIFFFVVTVVEITIINPPTIIKVIIFIM